MKPHFIFFYGILFSLLLSACVIRVHPKPKYNERKPVVYLYPEKEEKVSVQVLSDFKLTLTEPEYKNGWKVIAHPDGKLVNEVDGKEFPYLFYEATDDHTYSFEKGFCIPGDSTANFLKNILPQMGLTAAEYNEFISYWTPFMQNNKFNIITFPYEEHAQLVKLKISPQPETIIRTFMVFKSAEKSVTILPQTFSSPKRKGFTVVEWGGIDVDPTDLVQ